MSAVAKAAVLSTGLTVALATAATIVVVLHPGASPQSVASPPAATINLTAVALTAMATACTIGERARPVR